MDEHCELPPFFHEIFHPSLPRLGPGDDASTVKALDLALAAMGDSRPARLRVLDLGCGNGTQTRQLAKHVDGSILAVDNHQPFLDELNRRIKADGTSAKVTTRQADMNALSLGEDPFDLIWCEGAIFIAGFRKGIEICRNLLVDKGVLALTEMCWFKPNPPAECRDFLTAAYPALTDVDANLRMIADGGYTICAYFTLPETAWLDRYLRPLETRVAELRRKYPADEDKQALLDLMQQEVDIYRKHSAYYGYVFYVMQR